MTNPLKTLMMPPPALSVPKCSYGTVSLTQRANALARSLSVVFSSLRYKLIVCKVVDSHRPLPIAVVRFVVPARSNRTKRKDEFILNFVTLQVSSTYSYRRQTATYRETYTCSNFLGTRSHDARELANGQTGWNASRQVYSSL